MKQRLVDLWLAPLYVLQLVFDWFTLDYYTRWDVKTQQLVKDQPVNPGDAAAYRAFSGFIVVSGFTVAALVAVLVLAGVGVIH